MCTVKGLSTQRESRSNNGGYSYNGDLSKKVLLTFSDLNMPATIGKIHTDKRTERGI